MKSILKSAGAMIVLASLCSCASVKPWEKDHLAQKAMLPDGYAAEQSVDDHIYFSKEASTGGNGFGGGGCGCN